MEGHLIRKHFVRFRYLGSFFSKESSNEVADRDPLKVGVPEGAFAFTFYDLVVGVAIENGKAIPVSSAALDESNHYYYGGKIYTVTELKKELPNKRILVSNIECNGYRRAIKCRTGNWQPFGDGDVYIEEKA